MKIVEVHKELVHEFGESHSGAIVSFAWFLKLAREAISDTANQYRKASFPTRNVKIEARLDFNDNSYSIEPIYDKEDSNFEVNDIEFEIELIVGDNLADRGKVFSKLAVQQLAAVTGSLTIDEDDNNSEVHYTFSPTKPGDVKITEIDRDQVLVDSYFNGHDYDIVVQSLIFLFDFDEYVQDFFDLLPAPNVIDMLLSYKLNPPYAIYTKTLRTLYGDMDFILTKGQESTTTRTFCECGVPGGIRYEDERTTRGDGDQSSSRNSRTVIVDELGPVNGLLNGPPEVGFFLPMMDSRGKYYTLLDEMSSSTSLVTTITGSGKKSGVKYGYKITASAAIEDFSPTIDFDLATQVYTLVINIPHEITGKVWGSKKIGCVKIPFSWKLTNGRLNPYTITMTSSLVRTQNGPEVLWVPEIEAEVHFRLKPEGIFSFLALFFMGRIDRDVIADRIEQRSLDSVVRLVQPILDSLPIPSGGLPIPRVAISMTEGSMFIAISSETG